MSRQNIPVLDRGEVAGAEGLERGGYVLWDSPATNPVSQAPDGKAPAANVPDVILIATGAEVPPTLAAGQALAADGASVRVVSMPCMELFEAESPDYREQVLPREVTARLAVEPGATMSWWKWVGLDGEVLGLDRFGASAPGQTVLDKLGFSSANIAARARALLERAG